MDGVATQQTTAQHRQAANLLMELATMIPQLPQIPALEEQARMGNVDLDLGLVLQMNVVRLQDLRDHRRSYFLCSFLYVNGRLADYCEAPDCRFNYGPVCDANKIPSGTNTSSIPRTQLGSVLYGSDGIYDCVNAGEMALTFDDGPFIYTSHILDVLAQYNAPATFFITGNNNGEFSIATES